MKFTNPPALVTFDIDGTLAISEEMTAEEWQRLCSDTKKLDDMFYAQNIAHPELPNFLKFLRQNNRYHIGIVTGREAISRTSTIAWLERNGFWYDWLAVAIRDEERTRFLKTTQSVWHFDDDYGVVRSLGHSGIYVWNNLWPSNTIDTPKSWEQVFKDFSYKF